MHKRRLKTGLLLLYFLVLIVSCIQPLYPREMYLQHSVTLLVAIFLVYVTIKNSLSNSSFIFIVLFMIFHMIGARWIYSNTPYDQWINSLTGFSIDSFFGFQRNQYDRMIHFLFGFLIVIPLSEINIRWFSFPPKKALFVALLLILSMSSIYEIFEWVISIVLSPYDAEAYNGQQGDFWDSQKDMALAMAGALVMSGIFYLKGWISGIYRK